MSLNINKHYLISLFALILIMLLTALPAAAHKVVLYAYVEGGQIVAEASYGDGSAVKEGKIKMFDESGQLLKEGVTNEKGISRLNIPAKTNLKLKLEAGMGHQAQYTINKSQLPDLQKNISKSKENSQSQSQLEETSSKTMDGISEKKLRTIVSQELDKKISPLNKKIVQIENDKGPGITEIIGGIGYIFGLMGLALYFKKGRK